jgi:hypothetical protein
MIPVFERAKIFHALDRAATVISEVNINATKSIDIRDQYEREVYVLILATGTEECNFSTRTFK